MQKKNVYISQLSLVLVQKLKEGMKEGRRIVYLLQIAGCG